MEVEERKIELTRILNGLRKDSIWVPESTRGTINPEYRGNTPGPGLIEIKGNSNGPMDMDTFFKSNIRILYLLKEPFIEEQSFKKGDRGGHDQSRDYAGVDFDSLGNATYENIVRNVYSAISLQQFTDSDQDIVRTAVNFFNSSVCIINCNYFPGLQEKRSKKAFIDNWSKMNEELITCIISLCDPNIIIGGNTLQIFYKASESDGLRGEIFGQKVDVLPSSKIREMTDSKKWGKDFFWNSGRIYLNLDHPSYKYRGAQFWVQERQMMIDVIKWWKCQFYLQSNFQTAHGECNVNE